MENKTETGLTPYKPRVALTREDRKDIWEQAKTMMVSRFFPNKFVNAEAAFIAALYGHELGLSPQRAWKQIHVIQGIPAPEVHLQVSMVRQAIPGLIWRIKEHTKDICVIEHGRTKDDLNITDFTREEAVVAGLASKDNWRKDFKGMLYCRAAGRAVRWFYPETQGGGLLHNADEIMDGMMPPPKVTTSPGAPAVPKKNQAKPEIEEAVELKEEPVVAEVDTAEKTAEPTVVPSEEEPPNVEAKMHPEPGAPGVNRNVILDLVEALGQSEDVQSAEWVYNKFRDAQGNDPVTFMEGYRVYNLHLNNLRTRSIELLRSTQAPQK